MKTISDFFKYPHNKKQKELFELHVAKEYGPEMIDKFDYYFNENDKIEIRLKPHIRISAFHEEPIKLIFKDYFPR